MRRKLLMVFALVFGSQPAGADLDALIEKNIQDAKRYDRSLDVPAERAEPPRLWLHIQTEGQKQAAQAILDDLKGDELRGSAIELKPIQKVDAGPARSQLRYFKKEDEGEAGELLQLLSGLVPGLELRDLSSEYANIGWIKSGHYELWLSPEVTQFAPSE